MWELMNNSFLCMSYKVVLMDHSVNSTFGMLSIVKTN